MPRLQRKSCTSSSLQGTLLKMLIYYIFASLLLDFTQVCKSDNESVSHFETDAYYNIWNNPYEIDNLNEFINKALNGHHCLIKIANFLGIHLNLENTSDPVITKKPFVVTLTRTNLSDVNDTDEKLIWTKAGSNISKGSMDCDKWRKDCLAFEFLSFSSRLKPWNCVVQIDIFPPVTSLTDALKRYPRLWNFRDMFDSEKILGIGSSIPALHFYICEEAAFIDTNGSEVLNQWTYRRYEDSAARTIFSSFTAEFFFLDVSLRPSTTSLEKASTLSSIWLLYQCFECKQVILQAERRTLIPSLLQMSNLIHDLTHEKQPLTQIHGKRMHLYIGFLEREGKAHHKQANHISPSHNQSLPVLQKLTH